MRALDRKLVRELWGMRGQALAIALVIVAGVGTYVSMASVSDALQRTLAAYYAEQRFADGFGAVRRAPAPVLERLRRLPGIGEVEGRVTTVARLEIPGFADPVSGLLVSVPEGRQPAQNRLVIREGRLVAPGREDEVVVNEPLAEAHGLRPGDRLGAIVNGRRRTLRVVGIALSPEFLMQLEPGALFPDPERFGVLWMGRDALAAAHDMTGAFNDLTFSLAPGAVLDDVLLRMDEILAPYGGRGAHGRDDQASHALITEELAQLRGMATLLPAIFLAVAAFLLHIVITRVIAQQREQIAVLKAFGYRDLDVGLHYVKLVLVIALAGVALGTALGFWVGRALGELYLEYFRFPSLEYGVQPRVVLVAAGITVGASLAGVVRSVRRAAALPPAEAMQPAAPPIYRATVVERLGLQRLFDQPTRMVLRHLERHPIEALLTIVGIASSCAVLIMGLFFSDALDRLIAIQFGVAQRDDVTVTFTEPTSTAAVHELRALPGVQHVEPLRTVPARLHHGHRSYQTGVEGAPPHPYLRRVIDTKLRPIPIPPDGIVLADRLAQILDARPGDELRVEVLEGRRRTRQVPVAAVSQQLVGVGASMDLEALSRLAGEGEAVSGAALLTDARHRPELLDALRDRPRVASVAVQTQVIAAFYDTAAQNLLVVNFVLVVFATVIAFGVIYNSARIALSERDRELASLRVLGFTRGEVAYILIGELAILTLLAIPLGFAIGAAASAWVAEALATDRLRIPLVLAPRTFAIAALIVLASAVASALVVRRALDRLDLVGVLKTRE